MKVQWKGENREEIEMALRPYNSTLENGGHGVLIIVPPHGDHIKLNLGDTLVLRDTLGIIRVDNGGGEDPFVTWKGDNAGELVTFLRKWPDITPSVLGSQFIMDDGSEEGKVDRYFLNRGDRLICKGGRYLCVSKAGVDHRV